MKKLLVLFLIVSFCQSCFTYKKIEDTNPNLTIGKKYKFKHKGEMIRISLIGIKDSSYVVQFDDQTLDIKKADIEMIKSGKFSWLKSILYPVGIYAAVVLVFFAALAIAWA